MNNITSVIAIQIKCRAVPIIGLLLCLGIMTGCALDLDFDMDMRHQPRIDPLEESAFFDDGASARPRVPGTVARGQLRLDDHLYTGRVNGAFAETFPFPVTHEVLARGQERYEIFCTPCHGLVGEGNGIVTEYGLRAPTSFHDPELRKRQPGYYFAIITNGTRVMPRYAAQIPPEDRWAIVAYMRALQLSQNADLSQLPPDILSNLD